MIPAEGNGRSTLSPSVRKVWIEITIAPAHRTDTTSPSVSKVWIEIENLLEEQTNRRSPSARKVWIEMISSSDTWKNSFVTFRKEGVD